jgi:hypothetical protein
LNNESRTTDRGMVLQLVAWAADWQRLSVRMQHITESSSVFSASSYAQVCLYYVNLSVGHNNSTFPISNW